jgi:predicted transcriptional regulator
VIPRELHMSRRKERSITAETTSSRTSPRGTPQRARAVDSGAMAVYIHCMIRTQLYLDEDIHHRLKGLAAKQGRTVSDLVREAVERAYGSIVDDRRATLEGIASLWSDRDDLEHTDAYVRQLRRDTRRDRQ